MVKKKNRKDNLVVSLCLIFFPPLLEKNVILHNFNKFLKANNWTHINSYAYEEWPIFSCMNLGSEQLCDLICNLNPNIVIYVGYWLFSVKKYRFLFPLWCFITISLPCQEYLFFIQQ